MVEWIISLQPQEELAAFARFGNAVASLCVEKKGARACLKNHFRNLHAPRKFSAKSCECMIPVHGKACNCEGTEQLRLRTKKEI